MQRCLDVTEDRLKAVSEGLGIPDIGLHKKATLDSNEVRRELTCGLEGFSNKVLDVEIGPHHQSICPWTEKSLYRERQMIDANVLVPVVLFILLSPGVLLSLPPGQSRLVQVITHAVVFGVAYFGLRKVFPQYY